MRAASITVTTVIAAVYTDEDQAAKADRDPVAPAQRSAEALQKVHTHALSDGTPAHSFRTLREEISTLVRNTCRAPGSVEHSPIFDLLTMPTPLQHRAFELIDKIAVQTETARPTRCYALQREEKFARPP